MHITKSILSIILIILVVLGAQWGWKWLEENQNTAETVTTEVLIPKVEVIPAQLSNYQITINSSGKVEAAKRSQLSAEVGGKITKVSDLLQVGQVIEKGEFLIEIDAADYDAAYATAQSAVADAQLLITQEEARATMNIKEWKKLGKGKPTDLVARKPQLESARAQLLSAEASVSRAKRNIDRTKIVAPYTMKIEKKYVEVGNYIIPGGRVLDGHSADVFEVRLPLTVSDYLLITDKAAPIQLTTKLGREELTWTAHYVRDEGVIDQQTLSLPIMAGISENEKQASFSFPPVGLYVDATIQAQKMENAMVIPRDTVKLGDLVWIVSEKNTLEKRKVNVLFTDDSVSVVEGIDPGEYIIISPLETAIEGMRIEIQGLEVTEDAS